MTYMDPKRLELELHDNLSIRLMMKAKLPSNAIDEDYFI